MAQSVVEIVRPAAHPPVCFLICTYEFIKTTIHIYYHYEQVDRCLVRRLGLVAARRHLSHLAGAQPPRRRSATWQALLFLSPRPPPRAYPLTAPLLDLGLAPQITVAQDSTRAPRSRLALVARHVGCRQRGARVVALSQRVNATSAWVQHFIQRTSVDAGANEHETQRANEPGKSPNHSVSGR